MNRRALIFLAILKGGALEAAQTNEAFEFLRLPLSARAAALGGAGVAAAEDWSGAQLNPAGLSRLARGEAVFGGSRWLVNSRGHVLGLAQPVGARGGLGLTLFSLDYGSIPAYDGAGAAAGDTEAQDLLARLGYGHALTDSLWIGGAAAYAAEELAGQRAAAWAADVGAIWAPRAWPGARMGISARNLGPDPRFDSERAPLPRTIQAGAAWRAFFDGLTVATDLLWVPGESSTLAAGLEYWAKDAVAFRLGYDGRPAKNGTGLTGGLGFRAWDFGFDYAYTAYGDLGDAHHFTLSYQFGSVAEAHYSRGMAAMRRADYPRAVMHFGRALAAEPGHRRALARLQEANALLQKELRPSRR